MGRSWSLGILQTVAHEAIEGFMRIAVNEVVERSREANVARDR